MKTLILLLTFFLFFSLNAQDMKKKEIWIDVRTTEEFNAGHIEGALHIPYETIGKEISKHIKDKNTTIKVYCKVGGRAGIAKKTLDKMGYKKVINAGGYKKILKEMK
ncbi:MAG: rhodanese-like domain-containing protein [Lentisphaeraceae bacterium]|nr:rhodanese-like domain-containing protein [Lentisphaeraceae bacterium]